MKRYVRRCRCARRCGCVLSGCASTPAAAPTIRSSRQSRDVRDQRAARRSTSPSRSREAYIDYRAQLHAHGRHATTSTTSTTSSRSSTTRCRASWDKTGNDMGRVMINTGVRLRRPDRHRVGGRHPARRRGFRPDLRLLGHPAGSVPVHSAVGTDHGARRNGLDPAVLWSPTQRDPDVAGAQRDLRLRDGRTRRPGVVDATKLIDQAALDPYTFVRRSYLQRREYLRVRRQAAARKGR